VHAASYPDYKAVVLAPTPADDPEDVEDAIHDAILASADPGPKATLVVLDLSALSEGAMPGWLKAAGPEVPDASLAIVVTEKMFVVAQALGVTAFFPFYESVEQALTGGR